jgi:hypothetical protein
MHETVERLLRGVSFSLVKGICIRGFSLLLE